MIKEVEFLGDYKYLWESSKGGRQMWKDNNDKIMNILDNIVSPNLAYFPVICPICGEKEAHIYFHKYIDEVRGGMWVWCSSCKHSAHTMFKIPTWWSNLNTIKFEELTSYPDLLEKNKKVIDRWINGLLYSLNHHSLEL